MIDYSKLVEALKRLTENSSCPCGAWFGNEDKRPHAMGCPVEQALPLARQLIEELQTTEFELQQKSNEVQQLEIERLKNKLRNYEDKDGLAYIDSLQARLSAAEEAIDIKDDIINDQVDRLERVEEVVEAAKHAGALKGSRLYEAIRRYEEGMK